MTQKEWLACDDLWPLLEHLQKKGNRKCPTATERKLRLFACACCRRIWHYMLDERSRTAVEVAERCADGGVSQEELRVAAARAFEAARAERASDIDGLPECAAHDAIGYYDSNGAITTLTPSFFPLNAADNAALALATRANRANPERWVPCVWPTEANDERAAQVVLFRDLFGNPFRRATLDPSWLTTKVKMLAQSTYDDHAFHRMPMLADALEEAGCTNTDILEHCRTPAEHVRGCWVVDLLLGKE
jgi:hypothetical protein